MRPPLLLAALLAPVLSAALPAASQELDFSPKATLDCMQKQRLPGADDTCIGESARACFQKMKAPSVSDIAMCMQAESAYWKDRMDKAYNKMMVLAAEADAEFAKNPMSKKIKAKLTDDLEHQQKAWEDWREIRCAVEAMMRRGTPYPMTAAANCTMKQIGQQAMFLESSITYMESK